MLLFSGSANRSLANKLASALAIPLSNASIDYFPDHEYNIQIHTKVRNKNVYIIQPTSPPTNDHLIELCLMVNALRRSGAKRITALVPYLGYSRQDFAASKANTPYGLQVIANIINSLRLDQIVTLDLHAARSTELFTCPIINLSSLDIFLPDIQSKLHINPVIVTPDIGGANRAINISNLIGCDLAIIQKQRKQTTTNTINILGSVQNRNCIIIDDIIDSGNTILKAANELYKHGAMEIYVYCTHAIFSGNAMQRLYDAQIKEVLITDSIELQDFKAYYDAAFRQLSTVDLFKNYLIKELIN